MQAPAQRRWLRYAAWTVAIGIAVAAALAVMVAKRFEPEDLARLLSASVKARTGRDLVIDGPMSYSVSLFPVLRAENVRLQNALWGSRPDMVTAKRVEVRIALLSLFAKQVQVQGLELIEPDLLLEVDRTGQGNWEFGAAEAQPAAEPGEQQRVPLRLAHARIENGVLAYRNAANGRELRLDLERLDIDGGAASMKINGKTSFDGVPVEIEATLPAIDQDSWASIRSELTLSGAGFRLHAQGTLPSPRTSSPGELAFSAAVSDWTAAGRLLQRQLPPRPALKANGTVRIEGDRFALENVDASLGKSRLTGYARWSAADQGRTLDVRIDSSLVDMTEMLGPDAGKPRTDGRIFSAEPFPLALLTGLAGRIEARIARLALRDGKSVGNVQITARFERGRVGVDPAQIDVEGKPLKIRLHADASSGKTLKLDVAVDGRGVSLGALGALLDITGTPEGSPTDVEVRMSGHGHSLQSLMASANGEVRVVVGPGRLRNRVVDFGADITELMKLLNPAYASDPYTELKCAVIRLPVRQGVIRVANSIGVETSKVNIIAAGTIDLRTETLDLGFRAKAASGLGVGLGTLAELGRLRGTIADPAVQVDLGGAATTAAHVGLAAITGGISLIASGLLAERVPDHPCQVALSGNAATPKAAPAEREPNVVDSLLGNVKKIFGR